VSGSEAWFLAITAGHTVGISEIRVLKRISEPKMKEEKAGREGESITRIFII
jgi:hypothetical protein